MKNPSKLPRKIQNCITAMLAIVLLAGVCGSFIPLLFEVIPVAVVATSVDLPDYNS